MRKSPAKKHAEATKIASLTNAGLSDVDFAVLRQQIRNRVGLEALSMVEATISAVGNGQYAALKYLFEAVGLFPADVQDASRVEDVLAPTLLRELGLPEVPGTERTVTKDTPQEPKTSANHPVE